MLEPDAFLEPALRGEARGIRKQDRALAFALEAAGQALQQAGRIAEPPYPRQEIATLVGSGVGPAESAHKTIRRFLELGPKGIRVNGIAPGQVWTPMVERLGPEARERRKKASPLGTEGTGWDVGWGAVYLASDEARWVTGHILVIDAGLTKTTR